MYEKKIFRVDYPTGYIEVFVGEFFGSADMRRIGKVLKLAKQYCSDEQRKELLATLRFERAYRRNILQTLEELEEKRVVLLTGLVQNPVGTKSASPENAIRKQMTKLETVIDTVKEVRWGE